MNKRKIFISYRQSDTQSEASRLKENLEEVFGAENVFFDIETLEPGLNFAKAIEKTILQSAVVLVLIGETWTEVKDESGNLRLFRDDDWVRREVAMALSMEGTRVIPVLVKDAKKLTADQLPDNIKTLADFQWAELTIPRWRSDVEKLVSSLEKIIPPLKKEPEKRKFNPPPKPTNWFAKNYLWILGVFVVIIIIASLPNESEIENIDPNPIGLDLDQKNITPEEAEKLREENPEGNEIYNSLQLKEDTSGNIIQVAGNWILYLEGESGSTLILTQSGENVEFQEYNVFNVKIGNGSGYLENNQLLFDYYNSVVDMNAKIVFSTQNNGKSWEGRITFPLNGASNNVALQRD